MIANLIRLKNGITFTGFPSGLVYVSVIVVCLNYQIAAGFQSVGGVGAKTHSHFP